MVTRKKIYNRIKIYRVLNNLSREDLAIQAGVNFQTIGYLEREEYNPSLELAFTLAEIFNVKIEELFSFEPFPTKLN